MAVVLAGTDWVSLILEIHKTTFFLDVNELCSTLSLSIAQPLRFERLVAWLARILAQQSNRQQHEDYSTMPSKSSLFRRGLTWLGLSCVLAGGPAAATASGGGYASSGLAELAAALDTHGWSTSADADGSLLIHRPSRGLVTKASGDSQEIVANRRQERHRAPDRPASLGEGLQHHDRGVGSVADGELSPDPPKSAPAEAASEVAATPSVDDGGFQLTDALARRGWDMQRDSAGNLFLIPSV